MPDVAFSDMPGNPGLGTVQDYVRDIRILLQDTILPYRYDDNSLLIGLSTMVQEMKRLRPDLFVYWKLDTDQNPSWTANDATAVNIEQPFRLALVYGTASHALARDQEDIQDTRAEMFLQAFHTMLLGLGATPIRGGAAAGR